MPIERYADHSESDAQTTEGGLRVTDESVVSGTTTAQRHTA